MGNVSLIIHKIMALDWRQNVDSAEYQEKEVVDCDQFVPRHFY